ncbi:SCO4225 family membrane protein [Streptomyces sp. NPDC096132]|uniref:SCO4225 family membrane protein n=1 Tax=Streptomyces sp. NPDC096132 TaxID=3366075 RepID=UPI0038213015
MTGTDPASDPGRPFAARVRHVLTDVFALAYLAICAVLLLWALVVTATDDTGEAMAGVIPLLATAPASLILLFLPDHLSMAVLAIAFGALCNAAIIGWCARTLRR